MHDIAFIFFAAVALPLLLLPVASQWRSRNVGILLNIGWLFLGNLLCLANAIVWWDNVANHAPVFCDISLKLLVGVSHGIAAASLLINRRLASIAVSRKAISGAHGQRVAIFVELAIGLGFPALEMILSYVPQGHRFDLIEGYGCSQTIVRSWPAILLLQVPPIILSLVSAVYGAIAIVALLARRLQFQAMLKDSRSGLTVGNFLRLSAVAQSDLLFVLPINIYILYTSVVTYEPWVSWSYSHANFGTIYRYDATYIARAGASFTYLWVAKWFMPLGAFVVFAFFGMTREALNEYATRIEGLLVVLRLQRSSTTDLPNYALPNLGTTVIGVDRPAQEVGPFHDHSTLSGKSLETESVSPLPFAVHVKREVV